MLFKIFLCYGSKRCVIHEAVVQFHETLRIRRGKQRVFCCLLKVDGKSHNRICAGNGSPRYLVKDHWF